MERPTTIQLPRPSDEQVRVDYGLASQVIKPLTGRFYGVESKPVERMGSIYLPDSTGLSLQSDLLTVIAVGDGVDLDPGDKVLVRPTHGDFIEDAEFGPYKAENRVRVYGRAYKIQAKAIRVPWWECAPCRVCMFTDFETQRRCSVEWLCEQASRVHLHYVQVGNMILEATGKNVLIRRDPVIRSERGIELPDDAVYRSCMATVVSVGSLCKEVKVGDRVHYNPMGLLDFMFGEDPDLAVCTEDAINAVIDENQWERVA